MHDLCHIQCLTFNDYRENTYIISCKNQCLVIDPGCCTPHEQQRLQQALEPFEVLRLINTHAHLDHVFGLGWLAERYQLTPYIHQQESLIYQHQEAYAQSQGYHLDKLPPTPQYWQGQQDHFTFAGHQWQVLWTPGHSPGHVCYYLPTQDICLTGDLLFKQGVGRTDLPMGDPKALTLSLQRLFELPSKTRIFPGHGPSSTLADEIGYYSL